MARWKPGAPERLQVAALDRFAERGYDATTVVEIAAAAGLTERTFFRHFTDKREVLFHGEDEFEHSWVDGVAQAETDDPMALVAAALVSVAGLFPDERRARARTRRAVIDAEPSLRERELLKMASVTNALTEALGRRGVDATSAALAAASGVTVFRVAVAAWIAEGEQRSLVEIQRTVLDRLASLVGTG